MHECFELGPGAEVAKKQRHLVAVTQRANRSCEVVEPRDGVYWLFNRLRGLS